MAGKRIQGITIEIGGETTKLQSALKAVDGQLTKTQSSLNDVNKLLKLDPSNTELLAQKQKLLQSAVKDTAERLKTLKDASKEAAATAENYDAWKAAYDPIQKEIDETKDKLKELKQRQAEMKDAGEVDTDGYKALQAEIKETNARMKELKESQQKVNEEFGSPVSPEKFDALQREIIETESKLKGLKNEIDQLDDSNGLSGLADGLKDVKSEAGDAGEELGKIGDAVAASALADTADILENVSDKLQEVGEAAYDSYSDIKNSVTKVNGYFGETGKEAEQSAKVIKEVYESGLGESMEAVADAVINVKKQLGDLSDTDLSNITQQALILEETYGIDMNESLRGVNALMQHFGMDAQTAMDYLVTGTQNGLDKTDELGDNLAEYSGKFAEAGYSADEYFQLLNNGLEGGAYNLDKVNDAINEVTTRLGDGTIAESIGQYSTKTQELFKAWQDGKATQKDVIDSIVADINNAKGQQEQWNLATTAFGTMAEDGGMKMVSSLTSVGDAYVDVTGKAQGLNDATTTPMQEMEANIRKLKDALAPIGEKMAEIANAILPPLVSGIIKLSDMFKNLPGPIQTIITSFGAAVTAISAALPVIAAIKAAVLGIKALGIGASIASLANPIGIAIAAITAIISVGTLLYQNWDEIKEKAAQLKEWIGEKWTALKENTAEAWDNLKNKIGDTWEGIKEKASTGVENLKTTVSAGWENLKTNTSEAWENLKTKIGESWEGIKEKASTGVENLKTTVSTGWENLKTNTSEAWNNLKVKIGENWAGIKENTSTTISNVKTVMSTGWENLKANTSQAWSNIKSTVQQNGGGIKGVITTAIQGYKSIWQTGFNAINTITGGKLGEALSTVQSKLSAIKDGFTNKMNAARDVVKSAIDKIKSFFNFSWSLPKLKMPHISISGKFSINPPSVPHFSISWYKKAMDEAYILNGASIFGAMDGRLLGGGEAGSEMVVGTQHMMSMIQQATSQSNMAVIAALNNMANRLIGVMTEYFPRFANTKLVLDSGTLVGEMAADMDDILGKIGDHKGRNN